MFVLFIYIVVIGLVEMAVYSQYVKNIRSAETAQKAARARSSLKSFMVGWPIFGIAFFYFILIPVLNESFDYNYDIGRSWFVGLVLIIFAVAGIKHPLESDQELDISDETKDSYLSKHADFALYLRAFHNDKYIREQDPYIITNCEQEEVKCFSEELFVKEMERFIPTCAIGMTSEIESPHGACRVYVDDATWKDDVAEIMEKATMIFVLVENRDSCIWEFEHSFDMRGKSVYIVDNLDIYSKVKKESSFSSLLPDIPENLKGMKHFFFSWQDDKYIILPFENTIHDYRRLAYSLNGLQDEFDKKEMRESDDLYSGLNNIWIPVNYVDEGVLEELKQSLEAKKDCCPVKYYDFLTLVDCELNGRKVVFRFRVTNVDNEQLALMNESFIEDLLQCKNLVFQNIVKTMRCEICLSYTDSANGRESHFVITPDLIVKQILSIN